MSWATFPPIECPTNTKSLISSFSMRDFIVVARDVIVYADEEAGPVERPQPGKERERVWVVGERWVRWVIRGVKVREEPPHKWRNMRVGVVGEEIPVVRTWRVVLGVRGLSVEDMLGDKVDGVV